MAKQPLWTKNLVGRARHLYESALRHGWIKRGPCEVCGAIPTDGHHVNYNEPYNIRWLCKKHHKMADRIAQYKRSTIIEIQTLMAKIALDKQKLALGGFVVLRNRQAVLPITNKFQLSKSEKN